ncbi:hypothetical protein FS837_009608 [Tulasnella sp. UAMH 9824]|nr:hypothetical protein FS837_009608 [Tulasnella sp. UAMH 9824]
MVSDFFHPVVGGVENHIYTLSAHLVRLGHKVVIISHSHHPDRTGVRHLAPGIKTYHIPFVPIASSATLPNYFTFLPYLRNILLRERIQLVHGHASLSSLAQEAILHAHLLGIRTIFTDHSLFGFDDAATILTNKLLVGALRNVDAVICVSNTGRENTVLRADLPLPAKSHVYVIPNAVIPEQFTPAEPIIPSGSEITIVVVSRLAYRKGMDLLVATAPRVCRMYPQVRFLIGGSGPKLVEILQMREKHNLQDQIVLLGPVKHRDVHNVLAQGAIYLNTSLTEAFGIGLLEAACAGLYVVSTRVGGVPEVLPQNMVSFASPDEDDLLRALAEAIDIVSSGKHDRREAHAAVSAMYAWENVTARTVQVYQCTLATRPKELWERFQSTLEIGPIAGWIYAIILAVDCMFFYILDVVTPRSAVDFSLRDAPNIGKQSSRRGIHPFSSAQASYPRSRSTTQPKSRPDLDDFHNVYEYTESEPRRGGANYTQNMLSVTELKELGVDGTEGSDGEADNERFDDIGNMEKDGVVDDEDDEEIDSDEAFGEDGEEESPIQRHGFSASSSSSDEGDVQALHDYVMELPQKKRKVDRETNLPRQRRRIVSERTEVGVERDFPGAATLGKLRLEDLLTQQNLVSSDTKVLKSLKSSARTLKSASAASQPLVAPLPLRLQLRVERQSAYRRTKEEMEKWGPTMRLLEKSEHLAFPLQTAVPLRSSAGELVGTFQVSLPSYLVSLVSNALILSTKPANTMESAVDRLLKRAKLRENAEPSEAELPTKPLSLEDIRARQAELRRTRESMSRAQSKAARIAKIKSKVYRKIKRREKEKDTAHAEDVTAIDPEFAAADRLQQDIERARERATLRHKNGSKWIRASRVGMDGNAGFSRGVAEMLQRGEALRERISGIRDGSPESESEISDAAETIQQALQKLDGLQEDSLNQLSPASGVLGMKFMQDAIARQMKEADQEAAKFKTELEQDDVLEKSSDHGVPCLPAPLGCGVNVDGNKGRLRFGDKLHWPNMVSSPSTLGKKGTEETPPTELGQDMLRPNATSGAISLASNPWLASSPPVITGKISRKAEKAIVGKHSSSAEKSLALLKRRKAHPADASLAETDDAHVDISLDATLQKLNTAQNSSFSVTREVSGGGDTELAVTPKSRNRNGRAKKPEPVLGQLDTEGISEAEANEGKVSGVDAPLRQRELVARAFAHDGVVEDFAKEKAVVVDRELPPSSNDQGLPGWVSAETLLLHTG